ncbi:hypothetical protein Golob_020880, partial [Gossypium lobatum]|nr:hypothetical protein [Gossypium lobatum]
AEDRILETYINNLSEGAPNAIYGHLQDAGFLYVARMLGGTKLDPTLISALVERWRPETHTFHLPWGECTITLEDVSLQLGLPVDGEVVTGPVLSADWSATCEQLLGKVPNKFKGSRIEMKWLEDNFKTIEASASDVEKEQFARAFILKLIGGLLMPDKSRNLVHLRWLLLLTNLKEAGQLSWGSAVLATLYREMCRATQPEKAKIGGCMLLLQSWAWYRLPFLRPRVDLPYEFPLVIWWNNPARHSGIPTELEDIRLALDQQTEEEFVWMPYANPRIQECIPVEFLANRNIWQVKVPLIVFATVEMHESNRVMRQFGCMQRIPSSPQKLDDLHNIDLRGRLEEDWSSFHQKYIEIWQRRYDYLPTREPFLTLELATSPDYMDWFRHNGKPYLLSALERSRQRHRRRQRRGPINPRSGEHVAGRSTSTPASHGEPIVLQPPGAYFVQPPPTIPYYVSMLPATSMYPVPLTTLTFYPESAYATPYNYPLMVPQTPPTTFFYLGGSSLQPPTHIKGDVRCATRTQTQSSTKEGDEVGDQHGRAREDEDEDDEESPTQTVRQNPRRARHLPNCDTHSGHQ